MLRERDLLGVRGSSALLRTLALVGDFSEVVRSWTRVRALLVGFPERIFATLYRSVSVLKAKRLRPCLRGLLGSKRIGSTRRVQGRPASFSSVSRTANAASKGDNYTGPSSSDCMLYLARAKGQTSLSGLMPRRDRREDEGRREERGLMSFWKIRPLPLSVAQRERACSL